MALMELRIHQQQAQLGLSITPPQLRRASTPPAVRLRSDAPQLSIQPGRAVLDIDQTQCFEDVSLRKLLPFARYSREQAALRTAEAIDEIVWEGNQLGAIEKGVDVVDLAAREWEDALKEFGFGVIPEHRPEIRVEVEPLTMSYTPGSVEVSLQRGSVRGDMRYGDVRGYYLRQGFVDISLVPGRFDRRV
jgi:hypothetical protein